MAVIKKYDPGEFCWTDLGTTDVAGAKKFYRALFGWTVTDYPMGMGDVKYSMLRLRGKDVCGLYPMFDEQRKTKTPPTWLPYVSVKSVDATVKNAKAAGGKLCSGPMDVMDQGRYAVIQDPTGAVFAIWQARKQRGAALEGTPGTVCWHDLSTRKPKDAGKFYTKVFGWKQADQDAGGHKYYQFKLKGESVCGMWPEPMKKAPPSWVTHWQVANCARTVTKAKRLSGDTILGTTLVPGMCRFAILADPQGATFGIIEFIR